MKSLTETMSGRLIGWCSWIDEDSS